MGNMDSPVPAAESKSNAFAMRITKPITAPPAKLEANYLRIAPFLD